MSHSWVILHGVILLFRFMFTLKDSRRPPCPPFSSLSSSPAWPRPSAAWLCLCSSSWRLSSSAARVLPWNQFIHTKLTYGDDYGLSWREIEGMLGCFEWGCENVCHLQFGEFVGFVACVFSIDQLCQQEVSKLRTLDREWKKRGIVRWWIRRVGGNSEERKRWPLSAP